MRFPWKGAGITCAVITLLVVLRCLVTFFRNRYYGGTNGIQLILADPWFYIGMAAAAIGLACFVFLIVLDKKSSR